MPFLLPFLKLFIWFWVALLALGRLTGRALPRHARPLHPSHPADTGDTALGKALADQVAAHPGLSGVYPLPDGRDAFAARALLADAAERSIDAQYYIWHDDITGRLLLQKLREAAARGVQVRLLLDDNTLAGMDAVLLDLDGLPNVEVRLFNPFMQRAFRPVGYLSDFGRLNRRMHNKSFTVDNQATVVGGRNVGDEYFGAGDGVMFADLDVLAVGPVVEAVSKDFDLYWNSASVFSATDVIHSARKRSDGAQVRRLPGNDVATRAYIQQLEASSLVQKIKDRTLAFDWVPVQLLSDDPVKGLGQADESQTLLAALRGVMTGAQKQLTIVSPYFVPTENGTELLASLARRGVSVAVLTNALSATDVPVVHAGYAKYRRQLLEAGVALYELKRDATVVPGKVHGGLTGSSGASLHAKTFQVDGERLFVGSFNMDPRSAVLNTELGLLIDDAKLAGQLQDALTERGPAGSYHVTLENGQLRWTTQEDGQIRVYDQEPHATPMQRAIVWTAGKLPIEWLL